MKTFTLFKRPGREAWYFRFKIKGKTYLRCLDTEDARAAQTRARRIHSAAEDAIRAGNWAGLESTKLRASSNATLAELIQTYNAAGLDAAPTTRHRNANCLLLICRTVLGEADPEQLPIHQISADLANLWFEKSLAKAAALPDQDANSAKISANSIMAQARSLFTRRALAAYRKKGCFHPHLEQFAQAYEIERIKTGKIEYHPPGDKTIDATLEQWATLEDRNLYCAIGLALAFGLRRGEILQATWPMLTTRDNWHIFDGAIKDKKKSFHVSIRALNPYWTTFASRVWDWRKADPTGPILIGSKTQREDTFRHLSDWLTRLGWQTTKKAHALRAFAGSMVAMRYGIWEAQTFLRHATVTMTETHYSHFVRKFRPADATQIPVEWATTNQPVTLNVLPDFNEVNVAAN